MAELVLAFDTATPATVVGLSGGALAEPIELRDDPEAGGRPRHTQQLLPLARQALERAGRRFADVDRIVVGTGPGSFTGLRIGLSTARALALGSGAALVGVSTLRVLAAAAEASGATASATDVVIAPILDARRGEVFVAAWRGGRELVAPQALAPAAAVKLAQRGGAAWLAVGDGAVRFREILELAGMSVPEDGSPLHRVSATVLGRLGAEAEPSPRTEVLPDYLRLPDAEIALRARTTP
jgi:tRNA threonylcarbamoyladenosine biosynthesis protein TsaB